MINADPAKLFLASHHMTKSPSFTRLALKQNIIKSHKTEFSDPSILSSDPFTALSSWYADALEPMCSYRSFRAFGLWKEYEATAALEAQKK